jgi:hypothetical protein
MDKPNPVRAIAGATALCAAMLAFALAFLTDWSSYLTAPAPKTMVQSATDAASSAAGAVKERVLGWFEEEAKTPPSVAAVQADVDWNKRGKGASVLLAVTAIMLASLAYVRREPERLIGTAFALAGAALAYQFVLKGLVALASGLLIAAVLSRPSK